MMSLKIDDFVLIKKIGDASRLKYVDLIYADMLYPDKVYVSEWYMHEWGNLLFSFVTTRQNTVRNVWIKSGRMKSFSVN